jgi:hypothetical protein
MSALFYDPLPWRQDLDFWPPEVAMVAHHPTLLLTQRCAELLAHLARWQRQQGNQCPLWRRLIVLQRRRIARMLAATPELQVLLADPDCLQDAWLDALLKSIGEANCFDSPDICPWTLEQAVNDDFFPEAE